MKNTMLQLVLSLVIVATTIAQRGAVSTEAAAIPFSPTGLSLITGKDVCRLAGEFSDQLGVDLDKSKTQAVQYRERSGTIALFLLSRPTERCGVVDAVLDLTPLIRKGENPEFKCYTRNEGGTTWGKWGHIVGLADNQGGRKRFVTARLAWRVNTKQKRFEQLTGAKVTCDTTGYAD